MPNYTVTNNIDALLKSTTNAAARTNLGLGDAATKNTGTAAGTVAAGDDSRITGAVQTTRTITAGTGLTGGGDLSANRTLAVSYGTTAGTAAQGNDARLSDARTPTAHAASHAAAGSDPITITATQISGSLTQNTTGTAANVTGTVAIANGGTGQTTANAAINALLPSQTGNSGKVLSTDGTTTSWSAVGGAGTVTSITAGTGLTGGTITSSGTVAADFGAVAGKITEGGTTVLKAGDTMTGKLTLTPSGANAPLNLGANTNPTPSGGDLWLGTNNALTWRGNNGATYPAASTVAINSFSAAQGISASTAGAVLGVTQTTGAGTAIAVTQNATGTGNGITVDINNTSSTAAAVRITNQGTGASLVVEDQASVDPTPFTISNSGRVGVGVAPDASVALSVDTTGIKFGDGTIQTTAGGAGGVSSFSAGTTGLTPATGTTGAVTLGGTLGVANGGTGATTLTGLVKGNGTSALSAAVAGTDYVSPSGNITGTASNVTGTVALVNGGTGQTTQQTAINALAGATTSGQYLRGNGTNVTMSAIQASDVPTLNQNTTGTASNVTGTVAISNGGTGQTTAANAINALVPTQSGQSGKVLTTNGSVVSWGTAGSGGITALIGDVSASGSGSVIATVTGLRGRVVATTAPTAGQVLGWNSSTNQWEPTSAGGSVAYDVLRVFIAGPGLGTYNIPSGYKYADIYAASGGAGGGSGLYTASIGSNYSGGGGGAHGVFCIREKVFVQSASLNYDIGAGGQGGVPDAITGSSNPGMPGTGTILYFASAPAGGTSSTTILDCAYYVNTYALTTSPGSGGQIGPAYGGTVTFLKFWVQNLQNGGNSMSGAVGSDAAPLNYYTQTTYVSSGGGGGGIDTSGMKYDGGNICDSNYILYSGSTPLAYNGTAASSSTIDATSVSGNPTLNIFWGGAGGASADNTTAIVNAGIGRAGNGANADFGCGGGGGGSMIDYTGQPSLWQPGSGGNGGNGFILMYLYK